MLRRAGIVVVCLVAAMLGSAVPALADIYGNVDCQQAPLPMCDVGAGRGGSSPYRVPDRAPGRSPRGDEVVPEDDAGGGDASVGGEDTVAHCSYVRSDYQPLATGTVTIGYLPPPRAGSGAVEATAAVLRPRRQAAVVRAAQPAGPVPGQAGAWYVYRCDRPGAADAYFRMPVWIPDTAPGGPAAPSPAELAALARNQLRLPSPRIAASPAGVQLVGLPSWLWLDRTTWGPRSATATAAGVSVTAVATPVSVRWSTGDGGEVVCPAPATVFSAAVDPRAGSPDCGHTYRRSSAGEPGEVFGVSATVRWTVSWSGAGQAGTFPGLTTSSTATFPVEESQALVTGGG